MNSLRCLALLLSFLAASGCERPSAASSEPETTVTTTKRHRIPSDDEIKAMLTALAASDLMTFREKLGDSTNPNVQFAGGYTLLSAACASGKLEVAEYLIGIGADPTKGNDRLVTPLHFAALYGRPNVIPALLDAGALLEARDDMGTTPLALAAAGDSKETLELLLQKGADPAAKNRFGFTPLQSAEMNHKNEFAEIIRNFEQKR